MVLIFAHSTYDSRLDFVQKDSFLLAESDSDLIS